MPYRPPHWLETAASAIVPPAAAEHALGDITECSTSSRQYLRHLLSVVPPIVGSQIRRRLGIAGLVFSAVLAAFALLVSLGVPRSGFFAQSHPWLRLAAPWAVWVAGNVLSVAYGRRDRPRDWNAKIFAATVIATLAVAAAAGVPVTRVAMAAGAVFAIGIVLSLPWPKGVPATPLTPQTLAEHARLFQKGIWWRNARETAAAVVVMAFNAADLRTAGNTLTAAGHLLLIGGTLFIVAYLYIRAGSRPVPREGGVDARVPVAQPRAHQRSGAPPLHLRVAPHAHRALVPLQVAVVGVDQHRASGGEGEKVAGHHLVPGGEQAGHAGR